MGYRIIVLCLIVFLGCEKPLENKESNNTKETQSFIPNANSLSNDSDKEQIETLKKSALKQHIENLSEQLRQKNLDNLQMQHNGTKEHIKHFEEFYNRKDLPKDKSQKGQNSYQNLNKAYELQLQQMEKLQQKNDEIW